VEESLAIAREAAHPSFTANALRQLAVMERMAGRLDQASMYVEESYALFARCGNSRGEAYARLDAATVALAEDNAQQAETRSLEALEVFRRIRDMWGIWWTLAIMAHVATLNGKYERAARIYGAVDGLAESIGVAMAPGWPGDYEFAITELRDALDSADFERAHEEGRAMPLEVALDYASLGDGSALARDQDALGPVPKKDTSRRIEVRSSASELSPREVQVLRLIAIGLSSKEMASELSVSVATVQRHIANIYLKANVRSRAEATAYALRSGVISLQLP
jgi:non-specific serine/threonine protein kinase